MNRYDKSGRALDYVGYQFFRKQKLMRKRTKQNLCREMKASRFLRHHQIFESFFVLK